MKKVLSLAMLLAAAAMAFSSCSKDDLKDDSIKVASSTTVFHITATSQETKTVFGAKDAGSYPTKWTLNKDVRFTANGGALVDVTPTLVSEGASATFEPVFTDAAASGTVYAFSPMGVFNADPSLVVPGFTSLTKVDVSNDAIYLNIPSAQTPLANSVDESAQAMAASQAYSNGSTTLNMTFHHIVAYGKMTITNFAGNIASVELQFPENINGSSVKYKYAAGTFASGLSGKTITLDPTNVVGNVFWFALAPTAGNSGEMKIIITDDGDDTYTKTIDLTAKALPFVAGQVSAFTANFNGIAKDEKLDVSGTYNKITSMGDLESGDYVIVGEKTSSSYGIFTYGEPDGSNRLAYTQAYNSEGAIPASITNPETNQVWTLAVDGSNVTIYSKLGEEYLQANSALSFGTPGTTFTASVKSNMFEFKASSTYLGVNKSSNYWRDYAPSTLTQTNGLVLFKKADSRTPLATPEVIVVDNEVAWDPVANAGSYNVKIGGKTKEGITGTDYIFDNNDFELETGYYAVSVVAVPSNTTLYKNSAAGEASGKVKVGTPKLAQPVLSKGIVSSSSITVNWDADANATNGYYCTISPAAADGQIVNSGTVTFSGLSAETEYTVTVYAIATTGAEAMAESDNGVINVTTASAGGGSKQYTLVISSISYTGANSYANCAGKRTYTATASDASEMDVTVSFTDVCNGSGGNAGKLQFKKSTGTMESVTDLGTVDSVTATGSFTISKSAGSFSVSNKTSGALYSTVTIVFTK